MTKADKLTLRLLNEGYIRVNTGTGDVWRYRAWFTKGNKLKKVAAKDPSGYLIMHIEPRMGGPHNLYAHRIVYLATNGSIPKGMDVHHKNGNRTDNRPVNLKTISKMEHARQAHRQRHPELCVLAPKIIRYIRQMAVVAANFQDLADEFGVSYTTISNIVYRRSWREIK